jgi:hypothetical protein
MSTETCGTMRELIPDVVGGRLPRAQAETVERHVAACAECAGELRVARMILASRRDAPSGLLERLLATVGAHRPRTATPAGSWWGVAAAAVAALALGIGIQSDPSVQPVEVPGYAYEVEEGDIWLSDDGLLAGAPLFDDLSDDVLMQLLDELSTSAAGGSA